MIILITILTVLIALYIALITSKKFLAWFDNFIDPAREWIYSKFENGKPEE